MLSLLSLFTLILFNPVIVSSINDEGKTLLSFKQSITQDPQGSLTNWNTSHETPCSWLGIICKQQIVVSITIPNKNLSGYLSSSLGSLSSLRHLNLRNNKFVGTLPLQLFNLHSLQSLVLYGNSLSGILPFGVGNLVYLQTLDLSFNLFNGSLPQSLVQCKKMKSLVLSHNNFSGFLPSEFGKSLVLLEKLDLSYNYFDGFINDDLGNLLNLQGTFDLSHNMFSGSIPLSFGNLPEKVYIDLSYNNLTGPIPQNGPLVNRGPTAFVGNPGLCGPPLKNLCSYSTQGISPSSFPYIPINGETDAKVGQKGLTKASLIAIIVGDLIGICVIGFLFSYCYSKVRSCYKKNRNGYGFGKRGKMGNECLCFRKYESDNLSESLEQYDLVALDADVAFDLDELLKASAFVLGKSGIGIVYKVVLENGFILAVRRLGEGGSQRFNEFRAEVEAIGKLRHRNIVMLRAYYWSVDEKLLIYDFIPNGNLDTAIHGKPGALNFKPLSWSTRFEIIKGVTRGLVYLHEYSPKKYVHGDLKPSNILFGHNMEPKISNFGLSRLANIAGGASTVRSNSNPTVSDEPQLRQASFGSIYQAPEALKVAKPSQKWDVYSFGIVILEMITGKSLLVRVGPLEIDLVRWMEMCIEEKRPLYDVLDPYLVQEGDNEEEIMGVLKIAMACTQSSPDRRPSMRHVLGALDQLELTFD